MILSSNAAAKVKVLNTDPKKFQEEGHLLWLDFALENELCPAVRTGATIDDITTTGDNVFISNGLDAAATGATSTYLGKQFPSVSDRHNLMNAYGCFNQRYKAPKTTSFISQPFGAVEYDLFHFECLSDGAVANNEFKISISNIKKSADPNYKYGTFDVLVRKFADNDFQPQVLERFTECSLDPNSENFVARKIGDKKVIFDFDADLEEERRLVISGRYPNRSLNIRIVINDSVYKNQVPEECLPFGFRGIPVLDLLSNTEEYNSTAVAAQLPPMPYTYKATKGKVAEYGDDYARSGQAGANERPDQRIYWGVKTTRIEDDKISSNAILESNLSGKLSKVVEAYTKFMGIPGGSIDNGLFVSDPDSFNNNKFSLARVAFHKGTVAAVSSTSGNEVISNAAYIRNGINDTADYTVEDPFSNAKRATYASLVHADGAAAFNKYSKFAKFTNVFYGGWDGLNILDPDIEDLNDKAASSENTDGGKAGLVANGLGLVGTATTEDAMSGEGKDNNVIASYRQAIKVMTDPMTVRHNLLAIPGIRDPYVTNFAANSVRDYSMAMYVMDIPNYDGSNSRIFDSGRPDVEFTANGLASRAIDNNYVATYFPDVFITDPINNRRVLAPASIAALGALSYNDNVSYPWFAPAGFNRGRIRGAIKLSYNPNNAERDRLYRARVNPVVNFSGQGVTLFGDKTALTKPSAFDRINVRRLFLLMEKAIATAAKFQLFEFNDEFTRAQFRNLVEPFLRDVQGRRGISDFSVVADATNNTGEVIDRNEFVADIFVKPNRSINFISLNFIATRTGVAFTEVGG